MESKKWMQKQIDMTTVICIEVDQINCPIQRDEEWFLTQSINDMVKKCGMKLTGVYFGYHAPEVK